MSSAGSVRRDVATLGLALAVLLAAFGLLKVAWSLDEHFITRTEFNAALDALHNDLHGIHDQLNRPTPPPAPAKR